MNGGKIEELVASGSSSTVPGTRPKAMIYKYTSCSVDYSKLAQYAYEYMKSLYTAEIKIAVLCGPDLSPRKLCDHLKIKKISPTLYDAGVEIFNTKINALGRASPPVLMPSKRKEKELATQQKDLGKWLQATSGILVTHESMFRAVRLMLLFG